jgi:hypothetical protein
MGAPERDVAQAKGFIVPYGYRRHRPEATLLYQLAAEHYSRVYGSAGCRGLARPRLGQART